MSQLANTTGLAHPCLAFTDHKDGMAICSLIDGHSGEHVDGYRCFAWSADDCRGGMVLITYLAAVLGFLALLLLVFLIHEVAS